MAQADTSFWKQLQASFDIDFLGRSRGLLTNSHTRIVRELVMAFVAVYICTLVEGIYGFVISLAVCVLFLALITADCLKGENPHWYWRMWVTVNMVRWTTLMLGIIAALIVFAAFEVIMSAPNQNSNNKSNIIAIIRQAHFRHITPASATTLEQDAARIIYKSQQDKNHPHPTHLTAVVPLVIFEVTIIFFILVPTIALIRSYRVWQCELTKDSIPSVPYFSQAWRWRLPLIFRLLIVFHYLAGGVFNIAAGIFAIDSLSYCLYGQSFIFSQIANLWS